MDIALQNRSPAVTDSPFLYRLTSLVRLPAASGRGVHNEATLYHDRRQLRVAWQSSTVDSRLKRGCLVALRGVAPEAVGEEGACLRIGRLELLEKPVASVNPFMAIPLAWVADRALVQRAAALWEQLGRPFQHLLNAVLWDGGRFYRYVTGPASTADYPWSPGSNFRQAVATAERAAQLTRGLDNVSPSVVIAAALLHSAGKADDYRLTMAGYELSERGYWVGGQHTILEWLAVARARVIVPEAQYLALVHVLIAVRGGAAHGQSTEAAILAVANRLQGQASPAQAAFPGRH